MLSKKYFALITGILVFTLGFSQMVFADQMDLQPINDNTIYSELTSFPEFPTGGEEKSCGACTGIMAGKPNGIDGIRRALLYFDVVNNLPTGINVTDAELKISVFKTNDMTGNKTMSVHPVTRAWGEAGSLPTGGPDKVGIGALALTGDATWTDAIYNDTSNWTTPGGDFDPAVASGSVGGIGMNTTFSSSELTTLVQQWVDGNFTDNGLLLKFNATTENTFQTARLFHSSEGAIPPILRVTYTILEPDDDGDGIPNSSDNCINDPNPGQEDLDMNGVGDVCDPDIDGDGVLNGADNCSVNPNPGQEDLDGDGIGDACDSTNLISSDTIIPFDVTLFGNLFVSNNSLLTLEPGFTLSTNSSLIVENGSGVLAKNGTTLIILS